LNEFLALKAFVAIAKLVCNSQIQRRPSQVGGTHRLPEQLFGELFGLSIHGTTRACHAFSVIFSFFSFLKKKWRGG